MEKSLQTKADAAPDSPKKPVSINAGRLNHLLVRTAAKVYMKSPWMPSRPTFGPFFLKHGRAITLAEASCMQFVAKHTSIPVPKIYCAFSHKGCVYIVMERIKGEMLATNSHKRSVQSQQQILGQLKQMIDELRTIPCLSGAQVGNIDGGPMCDPRFPGGMLRGPFKTILDFHEHLRNGNGFAAHFRADLKDLIAFHYGPWNELVLTHGDLSSINILARGDRVATIVDWETAGWFPDYWEYTTACNVYPWTEFWRDYIGEFLKPMPAQLRMERIREKYFGAFTNPSLETL